MQYFPIFSFILLLIIFHYSVTTHGNTTTTISLRVEVLDDWKNYLDFQNLHRFCPAERFKVSLFAEMAPADRREGKSMDQSRDIYLIEEIPIEWVHKSVAAHKGKKVVEDDVILTIEMAISHDNVKKLLLRNILKSSLDKEQRVQVSILHEIQEQQRHYTQLFHHQLPQFQQETQQQYFQGEQETRQQPQEQGHDENCQQQQPMQAQGGHVEEHLPRPLAINKEEILLKLQELRKKSKNRITKLHAKEEKEKKKYLKIYDQIFGGMFTVSSTQGDEFAHCLSCNEDLSMAGGRGGITRHLHSKKHQKTAALDATKPTEMAGKRKRKKKKDASKRFSNKYNQEFDGMFTVSSTQGDEFAHCVPCDVDISMTSGRFAITSHLRSRSHQNIMAALNAAGIASSLAVVTSGKGKEPLLDLQNIQQHSLQQQQRANYTKEKPRRVDDQTTIPFVPHPPADVDLELRLSVLSKQQNRHEQMSTSAGNTRTVGLDKPKLLQLFPTHTPASSSIVVDQEDMHMPSRAIFGHHQLPLEHVLTAEFSMPESEQQPQQHDLYLSQQMSSDEVDVEMLPMQESISPPIPTSSSSSDSDSVE